MPRTGDISVALQKSLNFVIEDYSFKESLQGSKIILTRISVQKPAGQNIFRRLNWQDSSPLSHMCYRPPGVDDIFQAAPQVLNPDDDERPPGVSDDENPPGVLQTAAEPRKTHPLAESSAARDSEANGVQATVPGPPKKEPTVIQVPLKIPEAARKKQVIPGQHFHETSGLLLDAFQSLICFHKKRIGSRSMTVRTLVSRQ